MQPPGALHLQCHGLISPLTMPKIVGLNERIEWLRFVITTAMVVTDAGAPVVLSCPLSYHCLLASRALSCSHCIVKILCVTSVQSTSLIMSSVPLV
ncbi:MAG: hypothetical protein CMK50_05450 [Propionibacteriaceae bacterium]|nr:hypothetical protein [Propionibacteriaceae bacterium]